MSDPNTSTTWVLAYSLPEAQRLQLTHYPTAENAEYWRGRSQRLYRVTIEDVTPVEEAPHA